MPSAPSVTRPSWGRLLLWLLATVLIWAIAAGLLLLRAEGRAASAESSVSAIADLDDLESLDLEATLTELRSASIDVEAARSDLEHPILSPLRIVPVAGRQLASARALVATADDLVVDAIDVLEIAERARSDEGQSDRVALLEEMAVAFERLADTIDAADLGPSEGLVGPLAAARLDVAEQLVDLEPRVDRYALVAAGLAAFLDDGRYLLLGANNAEMRLATGMHLSVGVITLDGGNFTVPGLEPADDYDPIAGAALLDSSVADRWGFLTPEDDFRKLGYSARFDEHIGPQALELWEAMTGEELDGVVALDPFVLEALLEVVGTVELEGDVFDSSNVLSYLLRDQYEIFDVSDEQEAEAGASEEQRAERRDRISQLASAIAVELGSSSWDPLDLVRSLEPAARGRHIMVYSVDPVEQVAWSELGVAGALDGSETGVFWLNTGASKLDPFLDVSVVATTAEVDDVREVRFTVTTTNRATAALPDYALGPWISNDLPEPATYRGRLAFYAPNGVVGAELDSSLRADVFGPDGSLLLVSSAPLSILPGETVTHEFVYRVPLDLASVTVLPSVRFPAVSWEWDGLVLDDSIARQIDLAHGE